MKQILLFVVFVTLLLGCAPTLEQYSRTEEHMGTFVSITVYADNVTTANNAMDAAFSEIVRIENSLSEYYNGSEIYRLNEDKELKTDNIEVIRLVNQSIGYNEATDGAFDITVLPILNLYKHTFTNYNRPPTDEEINATLAYVGSDKINLTKDSITLEQGMGITLGGIAKGYAVDIAGDIIEDYGVTTYMVNAGGDLIVKGQKPDKRRWNIALTNPRNKTEYVTIFSIKDQAVATSGDYERYFNENKTFHHIVDPRTGYSPTEIISATIIANSAMQADAMSTSVFVLGPKEGLDLVNQVDNFEAMVILRNKTIIYSDGWQR